MASKNINKHAAIIRVLLYKCGGDEANAALNEIGSYQFDSRAFLVTLNLSMCIQKLAQSKKTRSVDINIVIDIMKYTL